MPRCRSCLREADREFSSSRSIPLFLLWHLIAVLAVYHLLARALPSYTMSVPRSVYRAILPNLDKLAHGENPIITAAVLEARDDASLGTLPDLLDRIRLYQEVARDLESYGHVVADFDKVCSRQCHR